MNGAYIFTQKEKKVISLLKQIVTIKYGNYNNFKFKKESQQKIYKTITLYAPKSFNENTINAYLLENEYLIYKLAYRCIYPKTLHNTLQNKILYLGHFYEFKLKPYINKTYNIDNDNFIIYAGKDLLKYNNLLKFYKMQASYILPARVYLYANKYKMEVSKIKTGVYKTYWGSCCNNIIKLNERLMLAPLNTIDSVINHELAHIYIKSHSKEFYLKLEEMYPTYYKDHLWLNLFMPNSYPPQM